MRSETSHLNQLTPEQITTVLQHFAETLSVLSQALAAEGSRELGGAAADASQSMRHLAQEIGQGDSDVAMEIVQSSARLVGVIKRVLHHRPRGRSLH
jgi:hypothetical protein